MISPRKSPRSSCFFLSVTSLGGWLSLKPTLEARLALEVPRPAFRPSFPISHVHRSTIGEQASLRSIWVGFGRRSTPFLFAIVRIMTPKRAFDEGSEESTVQRPNGQVRTLVERPVPPSLSTGPSLGSPLSQVCVVLRGGPLLDAACVHYSHAYMYMNDLRATFPPNMNTKGALVWFLRSLCRFAIGVRVDQAPADYVCRSFHFSAGTRLVSFAPCSGCLKGLLLSPWKCPGRTLSPGCASCTRFNRHWHSLAFFRWLRVPRMRED